MNIIYAHTNLITDASTVAIATAPISCSVATVAAVGSLHLVLLFGDLRRLGHGDLRVRRVPHAAPRLRSGAFGHGIDPGQTGGGVSVPVDDHVR